MTLREVLVSCAARNQVSCLERRPPSLSAASPYSYLLPSVSVQFVLVLIGELFVVIIVVVGRYS